MADVSQTAAHIASGQAALCRRVASIARLHGPTPVVPVAMEGINLFAKLEYMNPMGSIKDKPALFILKSAIEKGAITPQTTIVESSSGNFAVALAAYCRLLGLRFIPVIDPNISSWNEARLRTLCGDVVRVAEPDEFGGFLKARLATVKQILAKIDHTYWPNQYGNHDAMKAHYELTGGEICNAMSALDYAFVGVSSCGTIAGLSQRLKERFPRVEIFAVDTEGSVIFGGRPARRVLPGLGSSIVPELVKHASIDAVVSVSEGDAIDACHELFNQHGVFVGGSTGSVFAAVKRQLPQLRAASTPTVLFLCCDHGIAYLDTIYNPQWCAWHRGLSAAHSVRDGEPKTPASAYPNTAYPIQKERRNLDDS